MRVDHYAYSSRVRVVDPTYKAGLALLVILLCLVLDRPTVGLVAVAWMWVLATWWGGLPALTFGRILLAEAVFLLLTVAGVAVTVSTTPQAVGWSRNLGPLWVGCSPASLETALRLATRALGGTAAMNFLALTTPLVDLIDALRRFRTPPLLIDLMNLVYRFIFTLLESATRMRTAQESRLGYVDRRRGMASAAALATQLLADCYQRTHRLQVALDSRGYTGSLRVLPSPYETDRGFLGLASAVVATMLAARVLI
jgi:cobalt/nickel transport system permease protein